MFSTDILRNYVGILLITIIMWFVLFFVGIAIIVAGVPDIVIFGVWFTWIITLIMAIAICGNANEIANEMADYAEEHKSTNRVP